MARIKVGFQVDEDVIEEFKRVAEDVGINPSRFVEGCMKAYTAKKFSWKDGAPAVDPIIITTEHEKRGAGRPPKDTEEKKERKLPDAPKCEYNGLDVWNSKNLEFVHYMQIPSGIKWPYNGDHELDQNSKWVMWDTKDKEGQTTFNDLLFVYFQEERPKFPDYETWIAEGATKFINRVARVFVLRNGYRDYNFNIRDVWGEFMAESKNWEKEPTNE